MYNKLFGKIVLSSIWLAPMPTRLVWVAFLATMDEDGFVQASAIGNVAALANVSREEAARAVECLQSPDPESGNPAHDGRRIERVPGGFVVLNAEAYKSLVTREISKQRTRERVRQFRLRNADVTPRNVSVTQSDTDTDTESISKTNKEKREGKQKTPPPEWDVPENLDSEGVRDLLQRFAAMRVRIKKPIKDFANASLILKRFDSIEHLAYALEMCIANEYQGLKPEYRPTSTSGSPKEVAF